MTNRKECKALLIDARAKTIAEVMFTDLKGLQTLVGGYIEAAWLWPNGDTLYVDEHGLHRPRPQPCFALPIERPDQAFVGNGVLVGREIDDFGNTAPPTFSVADLGARIVFMGER
jgi:hypothetical protein